MHSNQETVLRILETGPVTSQEVVAVTGLSKRAVSVGIGKLVASGSAVRKPNGIVEKKETGK